ncbi:G5 domain-containing protein [Microbacterium oleivorans]|uniref:G5 domain-containing protein n=1 Tax=Microbacterium oleivorans TaxID=273677 RepID=UPI001FCEF089|nr:G5 domain-containing protein [Microbacterium oleivorans]
MPVWAWVLAGVAALFAIILLAPLVAAIALAVLITAIIGLNRGSRTWLRLPSRRASISVVAAASMVLLVSGGVSAAMTPRGTVKQTTAEAQRFAGAGSSSETVKVTPTPTATPTPTPVTTTRDEVVTEVIAFERTTVEDPATPRGQSAVTTSGQNGERTLTHRVTLVDGVETGRELVSDVVTLDAVAEVTTVGTYDAPPPAAPVASDCNANYAEACVPNASDVDCAWGSGNGPAYFDGVARVVGTDVYDLDRDNDGLACER